MRSINEVTLLGHLGRRPELRQTQSGLAVCTLSIATNEVFGENADRQQSTTWHSVVAWRGLAETCQKFLNKGSRVLVRGRLQHRDYEHQGQKRTKTEIVASYVVFLDSKEPGATDTGEDVPF